jgi:hypothetical protein
MIARFLGVSVRLDSPTNAKAGQCSWDNFFGLSVFVLTAAPASLNWEARAKLHLRNSNDVRITQIF